MIPILHFHGDEVRRTSHRSFKYDEGISSSQTCADLRQSDFAEPGKMSKPPRGQGNLWGNRFMEGTGFALGSPNPPGDAAKAKSIVPSRASMSERDIAQYRLGDFQAEESRASRLMQNLYEGSMTRRLLFSLGSLVSTLSGVRLPRDYTRRRDLLLKWFDENYDALEDYAKLFRLEHGPVT
jgi:hypothetical protein